MPMRVQADHRPFIPKMPNRALFTGFLSDMFSLNVFHSVVNQPTNHTLLHILKRSGTSTTGSMTKGPEVTVEIRENRWKFREDS